MLEYLPCMCEIWVQFLALRAPPKKGQGVRGNMEVKGVAEPILDVILSNHVLEADWPALSHVTTPATGESGTYDLILGDKEPS